MCEQELVLFVSKDVALGLDKYQECKDFLQETVKDVFEQNERPNFGALDWLSLVDYVKDLPQEVVREIVMETALKICDVTPLIAKESYEKRWSRCFMQVAYEYKIRPKLG